MLKQLRLHQGQSNKSYHLLLIVVLLGAALIVAFFLLNNRGSVQHNIPSGNTSSTVDDSTIMRKSTPTNHSLQLAPNMPIVFLMTSDSNTEYITEYNLSIDSSYQTLLRFIPSLSTLEKLGDWASFSYAEVSMRPYTVDGRLFVVKYDTTYERSDDHSFEEYQPTVGSLQEPTVSNFYVWDPFDDNCAAIIDQQYFYRSYPTFDALYGYEDGEFKRFDFSIGSPPQGEGEKLIARGDGENCFGHLGVSNGGLYDVWYDSSQQNSVAVVRRDLQTGRIAEVLGEFYFPDSEQYTVTEGSVTLGTYSFAFDDTGVYWARRRLADGNLEIDHYDFKNPPRRIFSQVVEQISGTPYYLDADMGHVVVGDGKGAFMLLNTHTNRHQVFDLGISYYELQLLCTRE